jgi:tetraacyldisaccharide 4'-kinase
VGAIGRAAAAIYEASVRARSAAYDLGVLGVVDVPGLMVLSIGGIRAGGDGKTPLALHCAQELRDLGQTVAILCRGYRGRWERSGGVVSGLGGGSIAATVDEAGDEALMLARRARGIAVVVGADRVEAAKRARALGATAVVLDAGFQHRRLARQLDIVSVSLPLNGSEGLLPAGSLREPLSALSRSDLLGFELAPGAVAPTLPRRSFTFALRPTCLADGHGRTCGELSELRGARALLVSGIARPHRFAQLASTLGARSVGALVYSDHHTYGARDRADVIDAARRAGADLVLTTEKDAARLGELAGAPVRALRVEVSVESGRELLTSALTRLAVPRPELESLASSRSESLAAVRRHPGKSP